MSLKTESNYKLTHSPIATFGRLPGNPLFHLASQVYRTDWAAALKRLGLGRRPYYNALALLTIESLQCVCVCVSACACICTCTCVCVRVHVICMRSMFTIMRVTVCLCARNLYGYQALALPHHGFPL